MCWSCWKKAKSSKKHLRLSQTILKFNPSSVMSGLVNAYLGVLFMIVWMWLNMLDLDGNAFDLEIGVPCILDFGNIFFPFYVSKMWLFYQFAFWVCIKTWVLCISILRWSSSLDKFGCLEIDLYSYIAVWPARYACCGAVGKGC